MTDLTNSIVSIALAIVGVAFLAVLVSKNANTSGVIGSAGTAFSSALAAAEAPITGMGMSSTFSQPTQYAGGY